MPMRPPAPNALRLLFAYDGDQVRLAQRTAVTMTLPPSHAVSGYAGHGGHWFELRNAQEQVLYRRIQRDPMPQYVEVHSPFGPARFVPVRTRRGVFEVLVPMHPRGANLVLVGSDRPPLQAMSNPKAERARAPQPRVGIGPAVEFARFDLHDAGVRP